MKILVACECSGTVRDAFIRAGHDAISCDLRPTLRPGPHIQGNVEPLLRNRWDMIIAHPPCTFLSAVGTAWDKVYPWRVKERKRALLFIKRILNANACFICLENPVGVISTYIRKPDQIIQPYQFGDPYTKRTCLWLRNLPVLKPTAIVEPKASWVMKEPGGKAQAFVRSLTFPGIAEAMAAQWGQLTPSRFL